MIENCPAQWCSKRNATSCSAVAKFRLTDFVVYFSCSCGSYKIRFPTTPDHLLVQPSEELPRCPFRVRQVTQRNFPTANAECTDEGQKLADSIFHYAFYWLKKYKFPKKLWRFQKFRSQACLDGIEIRLFASYSSCWLLSLPRRKSFMARNVFKCSSDGDKIFLVLLSLGMICALYVYRLS